MLYFTVSLDSKKDNSRDDLRKRHIYFCGEKKVKVAEVRINNLYTV